MFTRQDHYNQIRIEAEAAGMDADELSQFIANVAHETGNFTKLKESTYYRAPRLLQIFGPKTRRDGTVIPGRNGLATLTQAQTICAKGAASIAEFIYGGAWGAKNLGNISPGDGAKFIGRGYIQITGKSNYTKYGNLIGVDLITNPDKALEPEIAAKIAIKFWLNSGASQHAIDGDYLKARKAINGGDLGFDEVQEIAALVKDDKYVV